MIFNIVFGIWSIFSLIFGSALLVALIIADYEKIASDKVNFFAKNFYFCFGVTTVMAIISKFV